MNDNELLTAVRESFTDVHSATPADQIVNRGRTVRARRRIPVVTGALAVAAGTAMALTTLLPASQAGHHQPTARLAAWTVVKQADGNIYVTIRQLSDPAGLQSTLRADGVPASVTFTGQQNPACQLFPQGAGTDLGRQVISVRPEGQSTLTIIDPSALPNGAGVQFASLVTGQGMLAAVQADLVQASAQCTGS